MFAALPLSAIANPDLGLTDFRVLASLASFAAPSKPVAWPSRASIGQRAGIKSESLISKTLHRLEDFGLIEIRQTGRTNLYRILQGPQRPLDAPEPTCTPYRMSDVHPVVHPKQTRDQTTQDPLTPAVGMIEQLDSSVTHSDQDTSPDTVEQSTRAHEDCHQGEEAETTDQGEAVQVTESTEESHQGEQDAPTAHREAVEPPESVPAPAWAPKAKTDPRERQEAVQRVLERFEQVSGIRYGGRATERKIARRVERYGLALVLAVIGAKGADFRHPLVLLKPSVLESVAAELERDQRERQQAIEADQKRLEAMRQGTGTRTREGAQRGLQALKAALGMRGKPPDDGALTA